MFLLHGGRSCSGKICFSTIGGVQKLPQGGGDCVLEDQPMGIPPFPFPFPLPSYANDPLKALGGGKRRLGKGSWDIDGSWEKEKKGLKFSLNFEGPEKGHIEKIPYIAGSTHLSWKIW